MREIEVKFLEVNVDGLVRRLFELGAKRQFEGEIEAWYFDHDDSRLSGEKKSLRLRRKGDIGELTLKVEAGKGRGKEMDEYEVQFSNYGEMRQILERMGLKETRSMAKRRVSYSIGAVHFEFDTIPGIPTFLEIEAQEYGLIEQYASLLGLSMKDAKPWSGRDVLRHYNKL